MFKQTFSACIAFLGLNTAAMAQDAAAPPTRTPPPCARPALADMAELQPVSGSNLMTVPVAINGTPRLFLLEVGRTPDQVSAATMDELHLPQTTQTIGSNGLADLNTVAQFHPAMFDIKSGITASDIQSRVHIASFTIGGATVHDVVFMVANDRDLGKAKPYDGLLTTGLFSQYDIDADFGAKKLSFLTATNCADPNQVAYWRHEVVAAIPMTLTNGRITLPVTIGAIRSMP
jgi:hypothetical protein